MRCFAMFVMFLIAAACASRDEQAVRHLVIAEMIERSQVPEERVQIATVRFPSPDEADVEAEVWPALSRGRGVQKVHCVLKRIAQRWTIEKVNVN
ncbi:MAG: hypothetical protein U0Q16_03510 [Bryobacteraceae bacterium]